MNRFTLLVILRVLLLTVSIFTFAWIFGDDRLFFTQIIVILIIFGQVYELTRFVNHSNREVARFLDAIRHADFIANFRQPQLGRSFSELQNSMQLIMNTYKNSKIENEAQYQLLQFLIQKISIGIIFLIDDEIELINPTAQRFLSSDGIRTWSVLSQHAPKFVEEVAGIGTNGRKLITMKQGRESVMLSLDVSSQIILGKSGKLITLQDIDSEIEQKEIEAWHKLIRILTHEIMNSITPISSLTETMQGMLTTREMKQKPIADLDEETISDILFSLKTINTRSEGLLIFVENYRKLSRVPRPDIAPVALPQFMDEVRMLLKERLNRQHIHLQIEYDDRLQPSFDAVLLNQVIINMITNSIHALEGRPDPLVTFKAYTELNKLVFEVTDNGVGIPESELSEIFVPFFSTRQEGSGIGLSLSKQIISSHGGMIRVRSTPGIGTSFYMLLPQKTSAS